MFDKGTKMFPSETDASGTEGSGDGFGSLYSIC